MRLALGQLALGACLAMLWASACGGATGRSPGGSDAVGGEAHEPSVPGRGGSNAQGGRAGSTGGTERTGDAGEPSTIQGGVPGAAGAASVGAGGVPGGDTGGAPAGGAASTDGGAGGEAGARAGAGGEAGAASECCEPLDCGDILNGAECGTNRYSDGCGGTFRCDCDDALVCVEGSCEVCDPGPDPCAQDQALCGQTTDRCGQAIACADNCAALGATSSCYQGRCCAPSRTSCSADDCGQMLIGCGQSLDCTNVMCPSETTCQPSGKCCQPTRACTATNCGLKDDGCGNYLNCSHACPVGTICLENECVPSECQAEAYECGQAYNFEVDGLEYCGTCPGGDACRDNFCLPLCAP